MSTLASREWDDVRSPFNSLARARSLDVGAIVGLVLLAALFRFGALGPQSLWLDDAWTALAYKADSLTELRHVGLTAPGFAALLRGVFAVAGFREATAQFIPFVAGIAAPGVAYALARQLQWRRLAGLAAGLLLALSPIAITYSARVKHYSLEALLALCLLSLGAWALQRRGSRTWSLLAVAAAVATTVSPFLALYTAGIFLSAVLDAWRANDREELVTRIAAACAYGVFFVGWYAVLLRPLINADLQAYWSNRYLSLEGGPTAAFDNVITAARRVVRGLTGLGPYGQWVMNIALVVLVGSAIAVARRRPSMSIALVLPTVLGFVAAALHMAPIGGGRTDMYLFPSLALLLAGGVDALLRSLHARGRPTRSISRWAVGGTLVLMTLLVTNVATPVRYPQQNIRPLVRILEEERQDSDIILLYPGAVLMYSLYTSESIDIDTTTERNGLPFMPTFADPQVRILPTDGRQEPESYAPTVSSAARAGERIWLLASHIKTDFRMLKEQLRDAGLQQTGISTRQGAELTLWE